jgi:thiol-disulfide isomerase/thioredoxin
MAPEMWINSGPLTAQDFQGSVTLVDVWATSCTKCLRSMAWVHALEKRYGTQGFRVVTVHTPQYPFESNRPRIEAYAKRFQLNAPIFMDHDARYQQALEAEYWPSFYLIDHQGQIRAHFTGQMESGTRLSDAAHTVIQELLAEKT